MRVEVAVLMKLEEAFAPSGAIAKDMKIRRATFYPDGTFFRREYLSFLTGEWIEIESEMIPSQCLYDDALRAIIDVGRKEE